MTDSEQSKAALDAVQQLKSVVDGLIKSGEKECDGRLEMCLSIIAGVVRLKNSHVKLVRIIADSPAFYEQRQQIIADAARIETECERFEHILQKNAGLFTNSQPAGPASPTP